ncbi:multidrug resistance protein A [Oryzomicrobium terrae]|uniref:Multidrug resistance protein A n=1 Tax=Oryzomicrobium terrae TaxID=1735038 RepID=A0A5C1E6C0_9RHOO|nr:HlyD family efflux transporter periplasmic adaptor subunit [Oryzomicrobium terrae]QEL64476.1 multidrug resistance protein A [Oryzomicrobium terrae]
MAEQNNNSSNGASSSRNGGATSPARKRGLRLVAGLFLIGVAAFVVWYLTVSRYRESTDNAYVAADSVTVASRIAGTVQAVAVGETDGVQPGQWLVRIDDRDARVALARARAELLETVRDLAQLREREKSLGAQLAARNLELAESRDNLARREPLAADRTVSAEELAHAKSAVQLAEARAQSAERERAAVSAALGEGSLSAHPRVDAAVARYTQAALNASYTTIAAPLAGVVAKKAVQPGQVVAPNQPLLTLTPLGGAWVEANFKESQLKNVRIGQPVTLEADVYGSSVEYEGTVVGIGAGTGAAFALLPAQNATGNWIKVTQRVPVRIALKPDTVAKYPLRVGLSMDVTVNTKDRSGALLPTASPAQAPQAAANDEAVLKSAEDEARGWVRTALGESAERGERNVSSAAPAAKAKG